MTSERDQPEKDEREHEKRPHSDAEKKNTAPDAVKDPNEKTEGKPGLGQGGGEADPGGG